MGCPAGRVPPGRPGGREMPAHYPYASPGRLRPERFRRQLANTGWRAGQSQARRDMASDAELIGRSLSGDAEAFMEVISRHEVAIGAYLERRAGREAAEDLLGDVWAAAFKYRGTYGQSYPGARPWLD